MGFCSCGRFQLTACGFEADPKDGLEMWGNRPLGVDLKTIAGHRSVLEASLALDVTEAFLRHWHNPLTDLLPVRTPV